jgi:hypothetical protein
MHPNRNEVEKKIIAKKSQERLRTLKNPKLKFEPLIIKLHRPSLMIINISYMRTKYKINGRLI